MNNNIVVGFSINPEIWFESIETSDPEKKEIRNHGLSIAGSSANIAQALSKLGNQARIIGAIGENDYPSVLLAHQLAQKDIHFTPLEILDQTSIAFIPLIPENTNVLHGKKGNLDTKKIIECKETIRAIDSPWRIASSVRYEEMPLAMDLLDKKYSGYRSLNLKSATIANSRTFSKKLLEYADLIILNKFEFELFKIQPKEILKHGPRVLIVTDGKNGGMCYTKSFHFSYDSVQAVGIQHITGAGDWFHASCVHSFITQKVSINQAAQEKNILEKAVHFASTVAAKKVLYPGGGNGPTIDML